MLLCAHSYLIIIIITLDPRRERKNAKYEGWKFNIPNQLYLKLHQRILLIDRETDTITAALR